MVARSRMSMAAISIAVILLIHAVVLVIADQTDRWDLFIPMLLLGIGAYYTGVGAWMGLRSKERLTRSDGSFRIFWGSLLLVIAALILINDWYPGNLLYLLVIFIIWVAAAVLLFNIRSKVPY